MKQNILGIISCFIAVASFTMSTLSIVLAYIKGRESYTFDVIDYAWRNNRVIQFLISISNRSDNPLTITDITFDKTVCELVPKAIRGDVGAWNFQTTPHFPLCIPAHGCQYAYLEFVGGPFPQNLLDQGKVVTFQIRTTRMQGQKIVSLGRISHYLHMRV